MPRDASLHSILVLGSGPIVIGQACEFDYSGTQAVKALAREGYRVILVNSNPATIMTDAELLSDVASDHSVGRPDHRTYIEPLTVPSLEQIIARERPDAILPTVGGQTAINLTIALAEAGVLDRYEVRLLGAGLDALDLAEDRQRFKAAMLEIGLDVPRSGIATSLEEAVALAEGPHPEHREGLGYPVVVRPSFTLGGMGGGIARTPDELRTIVLRGLELSPVRQLLIEESVLGWKEFELEVMRDQNDQCVVVCSIENLDPMGVHTGDSITVAPAMTLTDREYQNLRDQAFAVIRRVGVATGGSNIQFALHPISRRVIVIEMNPRVSRSSALASKATGFPIAKIAARLAVGYTLDEIQNDITKKTPACFEPALDYVVVKIPRWNFEKFPGSVAELGTQMKSVGEVMAIGRTFKEALNKGLRSLEISTSRGSAPRPALGLGDAALMEQLATPEPERIWNLREALRRGRERGFTPETIHARTGIEPWFLRQMTEMAECERRIEGQTLATVPHELLVQAKRQGVSDRQLSSLLGASEREVRTQRLKSGLKPNYQRIDTCAGEFESHTPYLYSSYESRCEANPTTNRKVLILGGGPIRIGQGIEFDYCACHAAFAIKDSGLESILLNCNPETVSTDYDTADRLYFEPITLEDVLHVVTLEQVEGVIVQFGGQTPLNLARALEEEGVRILGTSVESIDLAEDRERFADLLERLDIPRPAQASARSLDEARTAATAIGYPVIVRPSYVLGGRAMQVVYDDEALTQYAARALEMSGGHPLYLDRFLEDAFEVDVDALSDGRDVLIAGIQQHIEEAGIHSGDSASVLPPYKVPPYHQRTMRRIATRLARELRVVGLLNIQFAIKDGTVYVIEANPRASRTIPWVAKAIGLPLVRLATRVILGQPLADLIDPRHLEPFERSTPEGLPHRDSDRRGDSLLPGGRTFVKAPVFSSNRFPEVDTLLGPEMRSTGEVLGIGRSFGEAFAKAAISAGQKLPLEGTVFLTVNDSDKEELLPIARDLAAGGFLLCGTRGTAAFLRGRGLECDAIFKVNEGHPNAADKIAEGTVRLVINTPLGRASFYDESAIRKAALAHGVPCITTLSGSRAAVDAIRTLRVGGLSVESLQELHPRPKRQVEA